MKRAFLTCAGILAAASAAMADDLRTGGTQVVQRSVTVAESPASQPAREDTLRWRRPAGPLRVALQAGHWRAHEAPEEQAHLRQNGTRGGGREEWEVNLDIALRTARLLHLSGYQVEILPTTVPPGYWADLFISIHADGHPSSFVSGYRAAASLWDLTARASEFADVLERSYGEATGLSRYPLVTRRMAGYYAFNSYWYTHALHPMTTAVILETGFLTSPRDRSVIVQDPDRAARGIADAVRLYAATVFLQPTLAPLVLRHANGQGLILEPGWAPPATVLRTRRRRSGKPRLPSA